MLGGVFESDREESRAVIPGLSQLPFIGSLFQQQDTIQRKRELLIFLTPHIVDAIEPNISVLKNSIEQENTRK